MMVGAASDARLQGGHQRLLPQRELAIPQQALGQPLRLVIGDRFGCGLLAPCARATYSSITSALCRPL